MTALLRMAWTQLVAFARLLVALLRALLAVLRTAAGRPPKHSSSANPWLATTAATVRSDDEWALAIELQAAEHRDRRRALTTARGVTIVPDDITSAERAQRTAAGQILVTATKAAAGPVEFDG